jgi:hypothetical protein
LLGRSGLEGAVVSAGVLLGAGARAVLEVDAVDLDRDALLARAGLERARLKAPRKRDGLALDEVLGGRLRLAFPDDQIDIQRVGVAVAAVAKASQALTGSL